MLGKLMVGLAEGDITPQWPVELAAWRGSRGAGCKHSGVRSEIAASVLCWRLDDVSGVIVALDLTWVDAAFCEQVAERVGTKIGIPAHAVWFCASHSHSTPQVALDMEIYGACDDDYRTSLMTDIECLVIEAWDNLRPMEMTCSDSIELDLPIVSRTSKGGFLGLGNSFYNAPNLLAPAEKTVRCFSIWEGQTLRGVVYSLACHPVFCGENFINPDFPGRVRSQIKEAFGESTTVLFLQGFAGNLKPHSPGKPSLRQRIKSFLRFGSFQRAWARYQPSDLEDFSQTLSAAIINSCKGASVAAGAEVSSASAIRCLPVGGGEREPYVTVSCMDVPNGVRLVGMSAEPFFSYAKPMCSNREVWPVGYCNGMYGYLVDRDVVTVANGYEYSSWRYFNQLGPLTHADCEELRLALSSAAEGGEN